MAKLTITALDNASQFFGTTEYAMFQCATETNNLIVVGLSHNFLNNKKIDEMDYDNLVDTVITTKVSTNTLTGEINNPDDTLEKVLDGEYQVMLLGRPTIDSLQLSETYKLDKRELQGIIGAKMRIERENQAKREKLDRARDNKLAKIKKAQETLLAQQNADKDEENLFTEAEVVEPEVVAETTSDEAPF
jgi:hypothetical protein